jgi:hypothetical protein
MEWVMNKTYKRINLLMLLQFAERVNPEFGRIVVWVLLTVYAIFMSMPVMFFIRFPKPLMPLADGVRVSSVISNPMLSTLR